MKKQENSPFFSFILTYLVSDAKIRNWRAKLPDSGVRTRADARNREIIHPGSAKINPGCSLGGN